MRPVISHPEPTRAALRKLMLLPACVLTLAAALHAQIHKVAPPEKVTRAVSVYEWTGELAKPTAARIVPVSLFINGKLEDAGLYLTQPMPFVLQTGVVFSLEQAGKPEGTVTLDYARNVLPAGATTDAAAIGAWYGYGNYAPPAKPKPSNLKASAKIAPIDGALPDDAADDKPHFTGKQPGQGNASETTTTTAATANPAPADDPDRPHMTRRADTSATASTTPAPENPAPADDPDRPTLRHRDAPPPAASDTPKGKRQKQGDSSVIPMDRSLNDDPDRPTMQRGKPANQTAAPELHTPFPSQASAAQTSAAQTSAAQVTTAQQPDIHQRVAVSDAANREPHDFSRPWETHTERAEVLAGMQALAAPLLAKYIATYKLTAAPQQTSQLKTPQLKTQPKPAARSASQTSAAARSSTHTRGATPTAPAPLPLLDETLTAYELTYSGLPTFVYQAESSVTAGPGLATIPVFITIVAQRLPSGEFQVSFSTLTDAAHLDRTPRFRLIDAVDPDASHRADLLFELRASTSRQFALYRLVTAHAEQQFLSAPIQ